MAHKSITCNKMDQVSVHELATIIRQGASLVQRTVISVQAVPHLVLRVRNPRHLLP